MFDAFSNVTLVYEYCHLIEAHKVFLESVAAVEIYSSTYNIKHA